MYTVNAVTAFWRKDETIKEWLNSNGFLVVEYRRKWHRLSAHVIVSNMPKNCDVMLFDNRLIGSCFSPYHPATKWLYNKRKWKYVERVPRYRCVEQN